MYKIIVLTTGDYAGVGINDFYEKDIVCDIPTLPQAISKINQMAKENGWKLVRDYKTLVGGYYISKDGDYSIQPNEYKCRTASKEFYNFSTQE